MDAQAVEIEAQVLAHEIAEAVQRMLDAAEAALRLTDDAGVRAQLQQVMEACAVGDIANQRLGRIGRLARGEAADASGLLDGPASPGAGLDQAAVDALMGFD